MLYKKTIINTPRLTLRPLRLGDVDTMFAYTSDKDHVKFMIHYPDRTKDECMKYLKQCVEEWDKPSPDFFEFAILQNGKHIGGVSVHLNTEKRDEGELGWVLHRDQCGRGYATESVKCLVDWCNNVLGLKKLIAHCDDRNSASLGVMRNIHMNLVQTGIPRHYEKRSETATESEYIMEF